ncbi:hypothetical protein, partial [Levilactobacillus koreensis]|uniref:hypothetical protein n=1 Tax=Levilactobacillus koreensis TaxID=637971 RepID=UPI0007051934
RTTSKLLVSLSNNFTALHFLASLQHGRLWRHAVFVASKRARRLVIFQSEVSPQQAESLAAAVRKFYTILMVRILADTGARQVFHLSTFSNQFQNGSSTP